MEPVVRRANRRAERFGRRTQVRASDRGEPVLEVLQLDLSAFLLVGAAVGGRPKLLRAGRVEEREGVRRHSALTVAGFVRLPGVGQARVGVRPSPTSACLIRGPSFPRRDFVGLLLGDRISTATVRGSARTAARVATSAWSVLGASRAKSTTLLRMVERLSLVGASSAACSESVTHLALWSTDTAPCCRPIAGQRSAPTAQPPRGGRREEVVRGCLTGS